MSNDTKDRALLEALIPAVAYYRVSTGEQELSVADQRREVSAWASAKGYLIVREYVDEARSGSKDPEKRTAFAKMVKDSTAGDFKVIVCWNTARFGRLDSQEAALAKWVLRQNGVSLDTKSDGPLNWEDPMDRLKDAFLSEMNHAVSVSLSKDTNRGRLNVLTLGYWPNGVVPYGYDREYTDGERKVFVRRGEPYSKGKRWHLRLVVNEEEARVVRDVFALRVEKRWSLRQIAMRLNEKKVKPPAGPGGKTNGSWSHVNVGVVLREKAYIGVASIGGRRKLRTTTHTKIEPVERPDSCPAIVDPAAWAEAQRITTEQHDAKSRPQTARGGTLSGFLFCGHCGYRMNKRDVKGQAMYQCGSASTRPHLGCKWWKIKESELLPRALRWLVKAVDEAVVAGIQAKPPAEDGASEQESILAAQERALAARADNAEDSALEAPAGNRESAWAKVTRLKEELEAVRRQLELVRAVRNAPEFERFAEWWAGIKGDIVSVEVRTLPPLAGSDKESFGACIPVEKDRLRSLLGRLKFACKVWFAEKAEKGARYHGFYEVKDVQIEGELGLSNKTFPVDSHPRAGVSSRGSIPRACPSSRAGCWPSSRARPPRGGV